MLCLQIDACNNNKYRIRKYINIDQIAVGTIMLIEYNQEIVYSKYALIRYFKNK